MRSSYALILQSVPLYADYCTSTFFFLNLCVNPKILYSESILSHIICTVAPCMQALGPEIPVKEAARDALQKSHVLLDQAKQLQNEVQGTVGVCVSRMYIIYNARNRFLIQYKQAFQF